MKGYFVGTIEEEPYGYVRVEGYLFASQGEARLYRQGRFKRCVNRILVLTLGKFETTEVRSSRPESLS